MKIDPSLCSRLVGVVDLRHGVAVRGVGGDREQYRPVQRFRFPNGRTVQIDGCPMRLIECYREVGVGAIYLAELDGIERADACRSLIEECLDRTRAVQRVLIDLGVGHHAGRTDWTWLKTMATHHEGLQWIIASECAGNWQSLQEGVRHLGLQRVAAGCDYKESRWLSLNVCEEDWYRACEELGITTVVGLDLAAVGQSTCQRTLELCRRIRRRLPTVRYFTGGGVRSEEDANALLDSGADGLLVASWFVV